MLKSVKLIARDKIRLDKFISSEVPEISRSQIQKIIKAAGVTVNDLRIFESDFSLDDGDIVVFSYEPVGALKPAKIELSVLFENNDLAVIDKPAGLVVHPGAGNSEGTMAQALLARYPGIETVGDPHRPGIVHRLDEDTSGLIIVAKNQETLQYLKQQFLNHLVEKEYTALVHGNFDQQHGVIDSPLEKQPRLQKMLVGSGKPALTEYWVKEVYRTGQYSLLRVKLHTGRTHQIRAHLAHILHPIVGDALYGRGPESLGRQFLHASRLKFRLRDGTWIELESELPLELSNFLKQVN